MSTTKDKSQGPYTVERIEMKGRDWWTVVGPNAGGTPAMDNATAKDLCYRLNAAYQAGQADRSKLMAVLQVCADAIENSRVELCSAIPHLPTVGVKLATAREKECRDALSQLKAIGVEPNK